MFPIPWNFPFRKKNGNLVNIGDAIDEGTELPEHGEGDAGKVLSVDENGDLEWSDDVNSEIQSLTNNLADEVSARSTLGAHNLLKPLVRSDTTNNVHYSIDSNGVATVYTEAGGATANVTFVIHNSTGARDLDIPEGDYYLSGCPAGGSSDGYSLILNPASGNNAFDTGNGAAISISSSNSYRIEIMIKSGTIITTPITFKPMVTLATDARHSYSDFTPYAMTNRELTENKTGYIDATQTTTIVNGTSFTDSTEYTIPSDGWYMLYTQIDAQHSGKTLAIYKNSVGDGNMLASVRTTGTQYQHALCVVPLKAGTKVVFKYGDSTIDCSYRIYKTG